jgi:4-oxalocrotonate tautomerase
VLPWTDLSFPIASDARSSLKKYTMPTIRVEMFEGRTAEQKQAFVKALTEATVNTLGGSPESVNVVLFDVSKSDWATGGVLWSDPSRQNPA